MPDEINMNTSIYNGEPVNGSPEQEEARRAARRERRAKLPKFELAPGERFYIPREELVKINREYFNMFDEMKRGTVNVEEGARSFMESVIFISYSSEIYKLQEEHSEEGIHRECVNDIKRDIMTPGYVRKGLFRRRKPNYALRLCKQQAEIECEVKNAVYRSEISQQEKYLYGAFEAFFEELKETTLEGVRRKERDQFLAVFSGILDAHEQKNFKMLVYLIKSLDRWITERVRGKRRRQEAYMLLDRILEYCEYEIKEQETRTSDITVLRLIAEILKGKPVLKLPAPRPEGYPIPECYESQNCAEHFITPDESSELEAAILEELNGAELDELYELENELDELEEAESAEPEENTVIENEAESEESEADELEDEEE